MAAKRKTAEASATAEAQTEAPEASKPPRVAVSSRRALGVGVLARSLIVEHPEWTYRRIADEVNARIEGAHASEKSVRWYSYQMRKSGVDGTSRRPAAG
ncbi:hypothetical protein [Methylopila musalis]|uniref:hypothetical protein n=1 Tax=Methylopila musalis TaxID=1134781 RepID=UPI00366B395C